VGRDTRKTKIFSPSGVLGDTSIRKQADFSKTEHGYESVEVELYSLDNFIHLHGSPELDLIKMHVKGAEFDVLCGMGRTIKANSPTLFIGIHNIQDCAGSVLEYLFDYDCEIYHVETGQLITHRYLDIINSEHIYCTRVNKQ
jgi:hypothetical protein